MTMRANLITTVIVGLGLIAASGTLRAQVEPSPVAEEGTGATDTANGPAVAPVEPVNPDFVPAPVETDATEPAQPAAEGGTEASATVETPTTETAPVTETTPATEGIPATEAPKASAATEKPATGEAPKGVWNVLPGEGSVVTHGTDPAEKSGLDETQKKVNELVRLANTNIDKGRVSEAVRNINDLITLKPYDGNYHFALGLCYRREGKYKDALKKYQDVLDLGGPKALVALLRAEAFAAEGNTEKVFEYLKEAAVGGRNIINDVHTLPLLSKYEQDTEFIKLALQLEKFGVMAARSHDPFTNRFPGPDMKGPGDKELSGLDVSLSPEEQEKLLQDARKLYERVQVFIKLEDETKAMKAYGSLREIVKKKDYLTIPKIVNDFRVLVARLENLEVEIEGIRLKYYYNQAQGKLKQMKELFTDGDYQRVEVIHGELVRLTQEMQQTNPHYKPVAEQVLTAGNRWLNRARIRQEFDARKPTIQGIVIAPDTKMALLNERVVKQGETLDDFRVVRVESNKVTFRYKGEEIPLVFRRY